MSYVSHVKLAPAHIRKLFNDMPISVKANHMEGGSIDAQLHFYHKKDLNRFHKNVEKGKSTRFNGKHLSNVMIHDGDGIYSPISQHEMVGGKLTLKGIGRSIRKGFQKLGKDLKPVGDAIVKTGKQVGKKALPVLKEIGRQAAPVVGEIAGQAANAGVTYLTGNQGLGKAVGKTANKASQNIYKKEVVPRIGKGIVMEAISGEKVETDTPSSFIGGIKAPSAGYNTPAERMQWVRSHRGKSKPIGLPAPKPDSPADKKPMFSSPAERMAWVRSHRGGSFAPL
jgi:hypothetical protein